MQGYIKNVELTSEQPVLDFGYGVCGPLTFIAKEAGCKIIGVTLSWPAQTLLPIL